MRRARLPQTLLPMLVLSLIILAAPSSALSASTDKDAYGPGECVIVTGTTADPNTLVTFSVYNPNGALISIDQTRSDDTGGFTVQLFCFPTEVLEAYPDGTYSIVVKDIGTGEELTLQVEFAQAPATVTTPAETAPAPETVTVTVTVNQTFTETLTETVTDTVTTTATVTETQTQTVTDTVTQTQTQTVTQTTTQTQTVTTTLTQTQTQTTTQTVTQTQTQTQTVTNTVTQTVTSMGATIGAAGIALVVGFAAAFMLSRSRGS